MKWRKIFPQVVVAQQNQLDAFAGNALPTGSQSDIRYSTSVLSIPIHFVQNSELTVTDEWQNLKEKLKGNYAHANEQIDLIPID